MNNFHRLIKQAEEIRKEYPEGTRIQLSYMNDPYAPVEPGTRGTVVSVDDASTLHMKWDNGRTLGLIPGEDSFRKLTAYEIEEENKQKSLTYKISTAESKASLNKESYKDEKSKINNIEK